ncbi:MAG: hypothetical protein LBU09_01000 [Endomicrobium sp.]|jgi:hypothetical protein|nr:hypothetical protein [Endomicrobium sp.]
MDKKYLWFPLLTIEEFEKKGTPAYSFIADLEDVGLKDITILKGFLFSILVDDMLLTAGLQGRPLFELKNYAAYNDGQTLYLGILKNEN